MKKAVFWLVLVVILGLMNFQIYQKEKTIVGGQTMLLKLLPRDPRSLMQGDYMVLRYEMAAKIPEHALRNKGCIVVSLDGNRIAKFERLHGSETLEPGEFLLFYRKRDGLRLGAESFMFQEGDAGLYDKARYGELKVDTTGASVLVGLRGEDLRPLGKKKAFE